MRCDSNHLQGRWLTIFLDDNMTGSHAVMDFLMVRTKGSPCQSPWLSRGPWLSAEKLKAVATT